LSGSGTVFVQLPTWYNTYGSAEVVVVERWRQGRGRRGGGGGNGAKRGYLPVIWRLCGMISASVMVWPTCSNYNETYYSPTRGCSSF